MLSKDRRIKKQLFPVILSESKKTHSTHFLLYIHKKDKQTPSQFSFSVSKKVLKNAVDRNKYRRRGYSLVSKLIPKISPGFLFLFFYKKGKYPLSFKELHNEIHGLLKPFI